MLGCMVAVISHTARSPRTEGNNRGTIQMNPVVQAWIIILLIIGYESYCSEQCELDLYQHDQSDAYPCPIPVLVTASAFVYISIYTQLKSVDSLRTKYNRVPVSSLGSIMSVMRRNNLSPLISKGSVISVNQILGIVCTTSITSKRGRGIEGYLYTSKGLYGVVERSSLLYFVDYSVQEPLVDLN